MTFDELKNGMKSLFFSLGAKTSDSNYAVGLYDKTSAEPKGLMGMSDLASVLGVKQSYDISNNVDLNTLRTPGDYKCDRYATVATLANTPTGLANAFLMEVRICPAAPEYVIQRIYQNSDSTIFYRTSTGNNSWTGWNKIVGVAV